MHVGIYCEQQSGQYCGRYVWSHAFVAYLLMQAVQATM
jgi:hypothetical protein